MRDLRILAATVDEKTYILDCAVWRSGGDINDPLVNKGAITGRGDTAMLNSEGYMCCLGQFALQRGVQKEHLLGAGLPSCVAIKEGVYDHNFCEGRCCSKLADQAISINDDNTLSVGERIQALKDLLKKNGLRLLVINGERWGFIDEI